jgi:lipopolysaccharide assembly protein A
MEGTPMSEESRAPGQVTQDSGQRGGDTAPPAQQANSTAQPPQLPQHVVKRTRMGGLWLASGSFAVVLLLLLIFILENSKSVDVAYFGAHGHVPLGVALLLAAVLGILMVVIPGTARIVQLRLTARRHRRADAARIAASQQQPPAAETPAPGAG